jgi:TetR/AcrR family transcriptional regulator, transcriptional repressor for nem operon
MEAFMILSDISLDKIMLLFLEKGYFDTSLDDIALTAGVSRQSLSRNFGGKQGLFHAMLQRFRGQVVVDATLTLNDPSLGMDGIKQFFMQFIQCGRELATSQGCFMIAVAANLPVHEPEAARVIEEFIHYLRSLFYKNLRWQQKEKQIDVDVNTEMVADFLVGNVVGLMTMLRSASDPRMLRHQVEAIIHYLSSIRRMPTPNNLHVIGEKN